MRFAERNGLPCDVGERIDSGEVESDSEDAVGGHDIAVNGKVADEWDSCGREACVVAPGAL